MKNVQPQRRAFNWLSVALVVACGLVLIKSVLLPALSGSPRAPAQESRLELKVIADASKRYYREHGVWPTQFNQLWSANMILRISSVSNGVPQTYDGWRHPFIYRPFDVSKGYGEVMSLGRDGKLGGSGMDSDIVVRFMGNE